MGVCLNLARCRGIADRVGSHQGERGPVATIDLVDKRIPQAYIN